MELIAPANADIPLATSIKMLGDLSQYLTPQMLNPLGGLERMCPSALNEVTILAMPYAGAWIYACEAAGASLSNAILSLAVNFCSAGMTALALEIALICQARRDPKFTFLHYLKLLRILYGGDFASLKTQMKSVWGWVDDTPSIERLLSRRDFEEQLGHHTLVHPVTLEPCSDTTGRLEYCGLGRGETVCFRNRYGDTLVVRSFLPVMA